MRYEQQRGRFVPWSQGIVSSLASNFLIKMWATRGWEQELERYLAPLILVTRPPTPPKTSRTQELYGAVTAAFASGEAGQQSDASHH